MGKYAPNLFLSPSENNIFSKELKELPKKMKNFPKTFLDFSFLDIYFCPNLGILKKF
jgi:hypothetical protein